MKRERLEVADAKRLQALETENAKLKKMLAEQMMNVATLKEMKARHYCARRTYRTALGWPSLRRRRAKRPAWDHAQFSIGVLWL